MKKLICLVAVLVLCMTATAFASSTPSSTTSDMTDVKVTNISTSSASKASGYYFRFVKDGETKFQDLLDVCKAELEKLAECEDATLYFGEVTDKKGNAVSVKELLEAEDALNVYEFHPVIAGGYKKSYGNLVAEMRFPTPYVKGDQVAVLIGLVSNGENDEQNTRWTAYEGKVWDNEGMIRVVLNPEIVLDVQNGTALLAVISK